LRCLSARKEYLRRQCLGALAGELAQKNPGTAAISI
jgi:hypothetical protein